MEGDSEVKEDFPPLLAIGRHPHTLESVRSLCVASFPASKTRSAIMDGLAALCQRLEDASLKCELWVDGSFLTEKTDPEDVDVVMRLDSEFADSCTPEQAEIVLWVSENLHDSHKCHSFVLVEWPPEHPKYWEGHYAYVYWMKQWGFDRRECLKGIAVIQFPGRPHEQDS